MEPPRPRLRDRPLTKSVNFASAPERRARRGLQGASLCPREPVDLLTFSPTNRAGFNPRLVEPIKARSSTQGRFATSDSLGPALLNAERLLTALNHQMGSPLDGHELADLAQDSVMLALEKLPQFLSRSALERWLCQVCKNEIRREVRGKHRRAALVHLGLDESADRLVRPAPEESGLRDRVRYALAMLADGEREVVRMKHFQELTFDELAALIHEPTSTIKSRYYRAVTRLQVLLQPLAERR